MTTILPPLLAFSTTVSPACASTVLNLLVLTPPLSAVSSADMNLPTVLPRVRSVWKKSRLTSATDRTRSSSTILVPAGGVCGSSHSSLSISASTLARPAVGVCVRVCGGVCVNVCVCVGVCVCVCSWGVCAVGVCVQFGGGG